MYFLKADVLQVGKDSDFERLDTLTIFFAVLI